MELEIDSIHSLVYCQFSSPSEEKGFQAFSEQTAFALSSVQEELLENFAFALRLQPLSLKEQCYDVFSPFSDNFEIEGNLKIILF